VLYRKRSGRTVFGSGLYYQRLDEELAIEPIGVSIPLSRIYDRVELPAEG
jgi:hypothetical protein